jgi:uncharacterized protein YndB with AHSA1/START domain
MELHMRYAYTLTTTLPASADDIYDAWVDSRAHSEMTGAEATQSDKIGAAVSAWGDYISGRNLELVPGERIVQTWRTQDFTDAHEDSVITVTLEEVAEGTLLTLVHSNVPKEQMSYEHGGWQEHYFEPMQEYFGKRAGGKKKAKAKTKTKAKPKAAPKAKAAKKKARAAAKTKPKARAKSAKKAKSKAAKRKGRK